MLRPAALVLAALALAPGTTARAPVRSAIFYYPWYGTRAHDGRFQHWAQHGAAPPRRIASAYYPARGVYSSADPSVVRAQMAEIARAGVDEVIVSWWGRGTVEDGRLPLVARAAARAGLRVAAHLEPYPGRTPAKAADDIDYLRRYGVHDVYVYDPVRAPAAAWRAALSGVRYGRVLAQTPLARWADAAGFDGIYTYDILVWSGADFRRICAQAHRRRLLCAPSVGPGFDAFRATGDRRRKARLNGETYDSMWRAALGSRADLVTVTSYNEWHEGTQIEPARRRTGYRSYNGAWGEHGRAAERAYLARTAYWTARLRRAAG